MKNPIWFINVHQRRKSDTITQCCLCETQEPQQCVWPTPHESVIKKRRIQNTIYFQGGQVTLSEKCTRAEIRRDTDQNQRSNVISEVRFES